MSEIPNRRRTSYSPFSNNAAFEKMDPNQQPKNPFVFTFEECWERMRQIIVHSVEGVEPLSDDAYQALSWQADGLAQRYLSALRKRVPNKADEDRFHLCLNQAERILLQHVERLNEMLCEMAKADRRNACEALWGQALKLTQVFNEIAVRNPKPFRPKARRSLYMPSLRVTPTRQKSRNGKEKWTDEFLGEAPEIARAIQLSAESVSSKLKDNRTPLGARCAGLVGECIHEIKRSRDLWTRFFTPYKHPVLWPTPTDIKPFVRRTIDELIGMIPHPRRGREERTIADYLWFYGTLADCGTERFHFLLLPELTAKTARSWWKGAVEEMVEARFPMLLKNPLWKAELRQVSRGTEADMLKELKDYSENKVKQFA